MASFENGSHNVTFQVVHIDDNKTRQTLGAQIACLVIAYFGVALRFVARRLAKAQYTSDDYITVLAVVEHHVAAMEEHRADESLE